MSKLETPLLLKYWKKVGGTLIEEFPVVLKDEGISPRRIDGVIIKNGPDKRTKYEDGMIQGKDIIIIQVKAKRLNMPLIGQCIVSRDLIKLFRPKSIGTVSICNKTDLVLEKLLNKYRIELEIIG